VSAPTRAQLERLLDAVDALPPSDGAPSWPPVLAVEEWRPVPGWEDYYEVSSLGRVRSLPRIVPHWRGGTARRPGREMRTHSDADGYVVLSLERMGQRSLAKVHRLVALAFLGEPPDGRPFALHRDGDPSHNAASNLYWGSQSDNERDKLRHGTHQEKRKRHCPQGHPYSPENTYTPPGTNYRQCRICRAHQTAKNNAARAARRRAARPTRDEEPA